jgi:microcompartment protein CcmK/EutM
MKVKGWAITLGIGAAAGAVAVMMLPKQSAARKLVNKAAMKVDDAVQDMADKINEKWVM